MAEKLLACPQSLSGLFNSDAIRAILEKRKISEDDLIQTEKDIVLKFNEFEYW